MNRSAGMSILPAPTCSQGSILDAVLIFHPEFPNALKKRSVPDRAEADHTLDRTAALPTEVTDWSAAIPEGASRVMAEGVSDSGSGAASCRSPATL